MSNRLEIVVDTLSIQPGAGGIRVYLRELLRSDEFRDSLAITLICSNSNYDAFSDLEGSRCIRIPWRTHNVLARIATQQLVVPWLLFRSRAKLLFVPVDIAPLLTPTPVITCLHSSHLNAAHGYGGAIRSLYNRLFLGLTLRKSRKVIAISEYVRSETIKLFKTDPKKMEVVYHGAGLMERVRASGWRPPADTSRNGPIIFIGTLHRHKRVDALLQAYAILRQNNGGRLLPELVVAGPDDAGTESVLRQLTNDLGLDSSVQFVGRIPDAELLKLYENSRLLVTVSEVEGFGFTLVEAMLAGLPVVCSNRSALPEIAADASLTVDPNDFEGLAAAMASALWDTPVRSQMIERGFARAGEFNWQRAARQTAAIIRKSI